MNRNIPIRLAGSLAAIGLLLFLFLAGCEAVFTTSLLSFARRDPSKLSPEAQVVWAEEALASGDPEAMAAGYKLVKDDPNNQLLAADLALELSGVPEVMRDMIEDLDTITSMTLPGEIEDYLDDFVSSLDDSYTAAAGGHFATALAADPSELSGQDMILGALCVAFAEADAEGGFGAATFDETQTFVGDCIAALPPDDPALDILDTIELM
jgi:hypothetical protein